MTEASKNHLSIGRRRVVVLIWLILHMNQRAKTRRMTCRSTPYDDAPGLERHAKNRSSDSNLKISRDRDVLSI